MILPNYRQIKKLMHFANAQVVTRDLFLEGAFVDIHKPKHIVEMGSCFGGMAIYFDQYLKSPYAYNKHQSLFFTLISIFNFWLMRAYCNNEIPRDYKTINNIILFI